MTSDNIFFNYKLHSLEMWCKLYTSCDRIVLTFFAPEIWSHLDIMHYDFYRKKTVNPLKGRGVSWLHFAIQV